MKINGVNYAPLRGQVTKVCKTGNPEKVLAMAAKVATFFDKNGWPDNWTSWRNQLADAVHGSDAQKVYQLFD